MFFCARVWRAVLCLNILNIYTQYGRYDQLQLQLLDAPFPLAFCVILRYYTRKWGFDSTCFHSVCRKVCFYPDHLTRSN